jgi:hypothetical protein
MGTLHIGSFGVERPPIDMDFDYFGTTIRVHPDASDTVLTDFMLAASDMELPDIDPAASMDAGTLRAATAATVKAQRMVTDFLRALIHPDDWEAFNFLALKHRQQQINLMEVGKSIIEAVSRFPTGLPSDSRGGRTSTPPNSTDGSSSPEALTPPRSPEDTDTVRALEMLRGQPWNQMAVLQAWRAREERNAEAAAMGGD